MIRPQFILDILDELAVDGFAGGGGASTGIEAALGRHVDHAMNHDDKALGMHRINHPQTIHHCEDIFAINPRRLTQGRRVGMGWFSPDCKHFSKAKGGKPLSKKIRGLAFVIFRWAAIRTRVIYMENVEEIQTWGPLLPTGKPDPAHRGRTFLAFKDALGKGVRADHPDLDEMVEVLKDDANQNSITREQLIRGFGYQVEHRELRACDYGAPTIRKRLFLIARCDGLPIVWPKPTHFSPQDLPAARQRLGRTAKCWRTVAECIDWSIPCNSIFLSKQDAKKARCKRPLAPATLRRIAKGVDRYVLKAARPFIVSLTHQGGDERVESVDEPAKVITGANRGEKAFVDATLAPFIEEQANSSNQRTMPADEQQLVVSNLIKYYGVDQDPRLEEPCHTVTTKERFGLVEGKLAAGLPLHQLEGAIRVAKFLREHGVEFEGEFATVGGYIIWDLGMRMLISRELFRAQGFSDDYVIDRAWLIHPKTGEIKVVNLTKTEQIRMCGNSVSPPVAEALVAANSPDLSAWQAGERKRFGKLQLA